MLLLTVVSTDLFGVKGGGARWEVGKAKTQAPILGEARTGLEKTFLGLNWLRDFLAGIITFSLYPLVAVGKS